MAEWQRPAPSRRDLSADGDGFQSGQPNGHASLAYVATLFAEGALGHSNFLSGRAARAGLGQWRTQVWLQPTGAAADQAIPAKALPDQGSRHGGRHALGALLSELTTRANGGTPFNGPSGTFAVQQTPTISIKITPNHIKTPALPIKVSGRLGAIGPDGTWHGLAGQKVQLFALPHITGSTWTYWATVKTDGAGNYVFGTKGDVRPGFTGQFQVRYNGGGALYSAVWSTSPWVYVAGH